MQKKKSLFLTFLLLIIAGSVSTYAFDFCKNNPSRNNGTCEKQDAAGQVECVKPPTGAHDCYDHGVEEGDETK